VRLENLQRKASAIDAPRRMSLCHAGFSRHRINAYRAIATVAAHAISVVAKPACPRIGGRLTNNRTAQIAAARLNQRRAQRKIEKHARARKGRLPLRADARLLLELPAEYKIAFPSSTPFGRENDRSPLLKYGPSAMATRARGGLSAE
jgi:hypothetical protein